MSGGQQRAQTEGGRQAAGETQRRWVGVQTSDGRAVVGTALEFGRDGTAPAFLAIPLRAAVFALGVAARAFGLRIVAEPPEEG